MGICSDRKWRHFLHPLVYTVSGTYRMWMILSKCTWSTEKNQVNKFDIQLRIYTDKFRTHPLLSANFLHIYTVFEEITSWRLPLTIDTPLGNPWSIIDICLRLSCWWNLFATQGSMTQIHWRIQRGRWWKRTPMGPISFIFMHFYKS